MLLFRTGPLWCRVESLPALPCKARPSSEEKEKQGKREENCVFPPPYRKDTFTLTLNYKGEALDEFWIKRSNVPPWTSGLSSIMTLGSVT